MVVNETVNYFLSNLTSLPTIPLSIETTTRTVSWQFMVSTVVSLLVGLGFLIYFFMEKSSFGSLRFLFMKRRIRKKYGIKNLLVINHKKSGFFDASMISNKTLDRVSKALIKFKGEDFALVINSPGGYVFHSLALSRLLVNYPGRVTCYVPFYAMSGASLVSLSTDMIVMDRSACLGAVDPQVGVGLFDYGSASDWEEVIKFKKAKANDNSIIASSVGRKCTKTIKDYLKSLGYSSEFVDFLTDGEFEHSKPLLYSDLKRFGVNVVVPERDDLINDLKRLVLVSGDGVYY